GDLQICGLLDRRICENAFHVAHMFTISSDDLGAFFHRDRSSWDVLFDLGDKFLTGSRNHHGTKSWVSINDGGYVLSWLICLSLILDNVPFYEWRKSCQFFSRITQ